jgi:hypothetical protein
MFLLVVRTAVNISVKTIQEPRINLSKMARNDAYRVNLDLSLITYCTVSVIQDGSGIAGRTPNKHSCFQHGGGIGDREIPNLRSWKRSALELQNMYVVTIFT